MESINHLKGYGKVNPETLENPKPPKPQKPISSALTICAVICLTLVITLTIAALIHQSTAESPVESQDSQPQSLSNSAESTIKTVCKVTRYPDSCFTSISALNRSPNPVPEAIFKLSLEISAAQLSRLSALFKTVNSDPATQDQGRS